MSLYRLGDATIAQYAHEYDALVTNGYQSKRESLERQWDDGELFFNFHDIKQAGIVGSLAQWDKLLTVKGIEELHEERAFDSHQFLLYHECRLEDVDLSINDLHDAEFIVTRIHEARLKALAIERAMK